MSLSHFVLPIFLFILYVRICLLWRPLLCLLARIAMECNSEHLIELERVISEHQQYGPVIIMGDYNAHLGTLGGVRGIGQW